MAGNETNIFQHKCSPHRLLKCSHHLCVGVWQVSWYLPLGLNAEIRYQREMKACLAVTTKEMKYVQLGWQWNICQMVYRKLRFGKRD